MAFLEQLDPEIGAVLDAIPLLDLADIPKAREEREALAAEGKARWQPSGMVVSEDRQVPGLPGEPDVLVRVHRPRRAATGAVLLWVHGGGHVLGTASQDDPLLDEVVALTGCTAVAVDWRPAPEHPFPAALHDCYAALGWLAGGGDDLRIDPARIVLGGASSGAGLAAGLALLARDRREHRVAAQVLIYPMLDDRAVTGSSQSVVDPRVWNTESNRLAWEAYLGDIAPESVPSYAAPARAEDLSLLPWTWIATAELDLFCDEDLEFAQRLMRAGVSTELHVYRGAVHGFDVFAPTAGVTRRFVRERNEAFRLALASG
jgi:acetyl esterase/lipase